MADDSGDVCVRVRSEPVVRSAETLESPLHATLLKLCSQSHKKPSLCVSSSHVDSVYRLVCYSTLLEACSFVNVWFFSSWTHCWERCLIHLGTHIIPFVTMVSERAVLLLCWRHWLLVRRQPDLRLHFEMAYQRSRGRTRGFRTPNRSEEAIGCQHD